MVKVWDVGGVGPGSLRLSWGYGGMGVDSASTSEDNDILGATAVKAIKTNLKWVAVAYRNATVKIFEVDSGKEVAALRAEGIGKYGVISYDSACYLFFFFCRERPKCASKCYGVSSGCSAPRSWL